MKTFAQRLFYSGLFVFIFGAQAIAGDTNLPPRLTIELHDGSRIIGTGIEKAFKFHSELLGEMKLKADEIRSIENISTNTERLTTAGGDSMMVSFLDPELTVKTGFGKVALPVTSISKLTVSVSGKRRSGLIASWLGENGGRDLVGGNDAILMNVALVDSEMGRAFSFNGINSNIKVPAASQLDVGTADGFTIMAWIKPSNISGLHPLIQWSDVNMLNLWIGIRPFENGVLRGDITDDSGNFFVVSKPDVLMSDVFQHVAFTYDKISGMGMLYVNGVIVAQRQSGHQMSANTKGDIWFSQPDNRPGNWSTGRMFAGLMDHIAIYNRALSASEIEAICLEEGCEKSLTRPTPSAGWYENWMR